MKQTHMVYAVLIFGIIAAIAFPQINHILYNTKNDTYEAVKLKELAGTTKTVKSTEKVVKKAENVELAIATSAIKEEKKEEVKEEKTITQQTVKTDKQEEKTVDNTVDNNLIAQLNKVLHSNLANTGNLFAKYCNENGVDPYLAVAIVLHETGCKWTCSAAVRNNNNVGGMYAGGSLIHYNSLEEGIRAFVVNLKKNYYDQGLNTPELMNKKYASSTTWANKINNYINQLKNA